LVSGLIAFANNFIAKKVSQYIYWQRPIYFLYKFSFFELNTYFSKY